MEGSSEVNELMESSVDSDHVLKRKENEEEIPQHVDRGETSEDVAEIVMPGSPDDIMEVLAGIGGSFGQGSTSDPTVEELTLSNYNRRSSVRAEDSSSRKGFWGNLTRSGFGGGPGGSLSIGNRENAGKLFIPPVSNYSKVADHIAESESRIASTSGLDKPVEGIRTKVLSRSGFAEFIVRNSLGGKEVTVRHHRVNKEHLDVSRSRNSAVRSNNEVKLHANPSDGLSGKGDEISLREWLKTGLCKVDKAERLNVFKQILKIVDTSHSQGLVFVHLRPSYLMISRSNQVRYVGSFVSKSQLEQMLVRINPEKESNYYLDYHLKRKRHVEPDRGSFSPKQKKLGESYESNRMHGSALSSSGCMMPMPEFLKLEDRWYASPEELNKSTSSFSSNIYSLGVHLFELFCYFETWELRSVAMSDLRLRILLPSFLSESPKEASFCLWLLHPDPSLRPSSRDILHSELINEAQDLFPDQSYKTIDEEDEQTDLLLHFLLNMKEEKEKQAAKLVADVGCLNADIEEVEERYSFRTDAISWQGPIYIEGTSRFSMSTVKEDKLMRNLNQLENAYFSTRSKIEPSETNVALRPDSDVLQIRDRSSQIEHDTIGKKSIDTLGDFFEGLCKYARYSKFELCGGVRGEDILSSANVICSLNFNRDEDYFATAGTSKKIKIFEFGALLNNGVDIHYPLIEMSSRSRFTCVCWNKYIKNYLASTDNEGVVQLWDASTGQGFTQYREHQKRAWSVDFSLLDPTKLASGGDDCSVKLWSINERNCLDTIRSAANVCCVEFSSNSSHLLAFGSADYRIYCYDLRYTRNPWCCLAGHGKAVSYVKFLDSATVVSASTDNSLKIWDLNNTSSSGSSTNSCCLTLSGHTNEKNFIGLSVFDGYIACGSETNDVFAYYRTLPMPIFSHKFGTTDAITGQEIDDDNRHFVSSVCWRKKSNMVVAANSTGCIKLLQMV